MKKVLNTRWKNTTNILWTNNFFENRKLKLFYVEVKKSGLKVTFIQNGE